MRAAVLPIRRLVMSRIERELLPVTDDAEAVGGDAERDEIAARGDGAPFTQRSIVLGGPTFVAVSFDGHGPRGVPLEQAGVGVQDALPFSRQVAAIELEKDRTQW